MLYDVLKIIEDIMELMLIYVGANLTRKYVFLEADLERDKQKKILYCWHSVIAIVIFVVKRRCSYSFASYSCI